MAETIQHWQDFEHPVAIQAGQAGALALSDMMEAVFEELHAEAP